MSPPAQPAPSAHASASQLPSAPKQDRSKRTLEAILTATRRLLKSRDFDAISISEIVECSRTSNGSFYARFPDKASLLVALQLSSQDELIRELESKLDPKRWTRQTFEETIRGMILLMTQIPDQHLDVFKAALIQSLYNPVLAENVARITERKVALASKLVNSKKVELVDDIPERLVLLSTQTIESLLQQRRIQIYRRPSFDAESARRFQAELLEIYLRILGMALPQDTSFRRRRVRSLRTT